jgi:putative nucleotidyltransferase with HDIG domain
MIYYRTPHRPNNGLSETLAKTMGLRDPFLLTHSLNVAVFAVKVARRLGISEDQVDMVRRSSMLHDIGKLGVSQDILSKPAGLTEQEYEILKTHPARGAALLQECPEYQTLIPIVLHHHEFFDGRGYPDGLAGEQIEIEARIVAVAEVVAAMSIDSPYRKACTVQEIINELNRCAGTQFDPLVVKVAIEILRDTEPRKYYSRKPRSNS